VQTVQELTNKLSNYYWSPQHPSTYVIPTYGGAKGLGAVAHLNFAAFNLTWSVMGGKISTQADHVAAITFFKDANRFVQSVYLQGEPIETWLTLLTQEQFLSLVEQNLAACSLPVQEVLKLCK